MRRRNAELGADLSDISIQSKRDNLVKDAGRHPFPAIPDLLSHYAQTSPDRMAILGPGRDPMTYGELRTQAREVVRALRSLGIGRIDRVAVVLPNGPEAAVAIVAIATGAVCVPLNQGLTEDEYSRYFGELRLAALLTSSDANPASRRVAQAIGIPVVDIVPRPDRGAGSFGIAVQSPARSDDGESAGGTDDAFILLTSGSTSRPKTVPLTHASVCLSARNVGANLSLGPRDRLLNVLSLFHGHGLISGLLAALAAGSSVVCTPGFDATRFFG